MKIQRFVPYASLVADLHPQRVESRPPDSCAPAAILPLHYRLQHRIGHRADEVRAYLNLVVIKQKTLNLPYRHPPRIHRDDLLIEAFKALLSFGDH